MTPNSESDSVLVKHISECIEEIREYTGGGTETIAQSRAVQRAVERVLQILAESAQRLDPALKETEPEIPWEQIAGLRNRLVHGYLYIEQEIIQDIIEEDLPQLEAAIKRMTGRVVDSVNQEVFGAEHSTAERADKPPGEAMGVGEHVRAGSTEGLQEMARNVTGGIGTKRKLDDSGRIAKQFDRLSEPGENAKDAKGRRTPGGYDDR